MDTTCPVCGSDDVEFAHDEDNLACLVCVDCDHEWPAPPGYEDEDEREYDNMDGDHESALASAGFGNDEDYGSFNEPDMDGMGPDFE
jgi:Zn ribbon nucleic-acid-binding protein